MAYQTDRTTMLGHGKVSERFTGHMTNDAFAYKVLGRQGQEAPPPHRVNHFGLRQVHKVYEIFDGLFGKPQIFVHSPTYSIAAGKKYSRSVHFLYWFTGLPRLGVVRLVRMEEETVSPSIPPPS